MMHSFRTGPAGEYGKISNTVILSSKRKAHFGLTG